MTVYIYEDACPLCGGEVRGNEQYGYFCKPCNVLFEKKSLVKGKKRELPKEETKKAETVLKQMSAEIKQEVKAKEISAPVIENIAAPEDYAEQEYSEETEEPAEEEAEIRIVASSKSDKMHISTCHFLSKIQKENWIHLDSLDDGIKKGYVPCVCIRRKGLMKTS